MGGLGTFLMSLAGPVVKKALQALGLGLVSYAAVATALNSALSAAKASWSGLAGDSLSLIQMSGMSTALSIITGALIARVGLMQLKKLEILK